MLDSLWRSLNNANGSRFVGFSNYTWLAGDSKLRESMLTNLLNHTNARPAGVSVQSTTANLTVGQVDTLISVRNADFSVKVNALVDEFTQLHNDAAGVAAVAPFHAVLGTCTAGSPRARVEPCA